MAEPILAFCYLKNLDDERNRCNLRNRSLEVILKGKSHFFAIDSLTGINFQPKKLWFPLIFGGLLASLSTVALIKELMNPWYTFSALLAGLFFFYYGNQGTQIMTISSGPDQTHFFVGKVSANLQAFRDFVLDYRFDRQGKSIFLAWPKDKWHVGEDLFPSQIAKDHLLCMSKRQADLYEKKEDEMILEIDPIKVTAEVRYEYSEKTMGLSPVIRGVLVSDAIVSKMV